MNELSPLDHELIEELKKKIAYTSGLEDKEEWVQKDFDFLVFYIDDKTGSRLSLSTIKRIWRNEYNRLPHISTLNTLSQLAFEMDWLLLKKQRLDQRPVGAHDLQNKKRRRAKPVLLVIAVISLIIIIAAWLTLPKEAADRVVTYDPELVDFSYQKSVENKIPNTGVFSYNIGSVKADSFFLQQSWDESRRVALSQKHTEQTDIYYTPGYFSAKLIANEEVIQEIPVHVTYDDWFVAVRQPFAVIHSFDKQYWLDENYLGISKASLTSKQLDLQQDFQLGIYNVREFNVDGDNFAYSSMFRMDSLEAISCPNLSLLIKGKDQYFWIMFTNKGCEGEIGMKYGEVERNGKNYDHTMFGTDIYQWQQIDINVVDKKMVIKLNGDTIFQDTYRNAIGSLKDISYFFKGIGMIDEAELKDDNEKVIFSDDFE